MKLKVCGMKYQDNIKAVAALQPDYLGFIFYEKSPRNFETEIPEISNAIKKVGVFVDASIDFVVEKVEKYNFKTVQLHGNESPEYCRKLKLKLNTPQRFQKPLGCSEVTLWKVFSIKDEFEFSTLTHYEGAVDYFLFDTKGKEKGGNGYTFDWSVLANYSSKTPFILSGGIGQGELPKIKEIIKTGLPIYAVDVNSKFEIEPGLKNIDDLLEFKKQIISASAEA